MARRGSADAAGLAARRSSGDASGLVASRTSTKSKESSPIASRVSSKEDRGRPSPLRVSVDESPTRSEHFTPTSTTLGTGALKGAAAPDAAVCRSSVAKVPGASNIYGNGLLVLCHRRAYVLTSLSVFDNAEATRGMKVVLGPSVSDDKSGRKSLFSDIGDFAGGFMGMRGSVGESNTRGSGFFSASIAETPDNKSRLSMQSQGSEAKNIQHAESLRPERGEFPELTLEPDLFFMADEKLGFCAVGCRQSNIKARSPMELNRDVVPVPEVDSDVVFWERPKEGNEADLCHATVKQISGTNVHISRDDGGRGLPGTPIFQLNAEGTGYHLVAMQCNKGKDGHHIEAALANFIAPSLEAQVSVSTMRLRADQGEVQERECRGLRHLTMNDAFSKNAVAAAGGLEQVLLAMDRHSALDGVVEQGCAVLRNLACEPTLRDTISGGDGIDALLHALKHHAKHGGIQEQGLGAMSNIACSDKGKKLVYREGVLDLVKLAMAQHKDSDRVQEQACGVLWNLGTNNDEIQEAIMNMGSLDTICSTMERHEKVPAVQANACGALANLVASNPSNKQAAATAGGVKRVCLGMKAHQDHVEVQRQGCAALWSLTANSNTNQAEAISNGAIDRVIVAMRSVESREVQENAFGAMRNLTVFSNDNKQKAAEKNVVSKICAGMAAHPKSAGVQRQGCGALWNLAAGNKELQMSIAEGDAFELCRVAMETHSSVPAVIENACGVLRNLAAASLEVKAATLLEERAKPFCMLMGGLQDNVVLQRQGCEILQLFCMAGTEYCEMITNAGGVETICNGLEANKDNAVVQERGCFALHTLLEQYPAAIEKVLTCEGLYMVCTAVDNHSDSIPVLRQALAVFASIAGQDGAQWSKLEHAGALERTVSTMEAWPQSAGVQEAAIRMLEVFCNGGDDARALVLKSNALPCMMEAMYEHLVSMTLQEHACGVLANLCAGGKQAISEVDSCEGSVKRILAAMTSHRLFETVQLEALRALRSFFNGKKAVVLHVLKAGAVERMCTCMKDMRASEPVQRSAIDIVRHMSGLGWECREQILKSNALGVVVEGMMAHLDDPLLQKHGIRAFERYLLQDNHRIAVGECGAIPWLRKSMAKHAADAHYQRDALRLVDELTQGLLENQEKAAQEGVIEQVCKIIQQYEADGKVQIMGYQALCSLAVGSAKNKNTIVRVGGIAQVSKSMGLFDKAADNDEFGLEMEFQKEELQELLMQGITLLWCLAANCKGSREAVVSSDAIPVICKSMSAQPENYVLQERACGALAACCRKERKGQKLIVKDNGIQLILHAMRTHPKDEPLQRNASSALWSLCNNSSDNKAAILDSEGPLILMDAMRRHPESVSVQTQACGALWQLAISSVKDKDFILGIKVRVGTEDPEDEFDAAALDAIGADKKSSRPSERPSEFQSASPKKSPKASVVSMADGGKEAEKEVKKPETQGLIELITAAMRAFKEDGMLQRHACELLRSLACSGEKAQKAIVEAGGLDLVCAAMGKHLNNLGLQQQAIGALGNITFKNKDFKLQLNYAGGIDLVLAAMETHIENATVQEFGCWILANLAANHAESALCIIEADALAQIEASMEAFNGNQAVQSMGYSAQRRLQGFEPREGRMRAKNPGRSTAARQGQSQGGDGSGGLMMTEEMMRDFMEEEESEGSGDHGGRAHALKKRGGAEEKKKGKCVVM